MGRRPYRTTFARLLRSGAFFIAAALIGAGFFAFAARAATTEINGRMIEIPTPAGYCAIDADHPAPPPGMRDMSQTLVVQAGFIHCEDRVLLNPDVSLAQIRWVGVYVPRRVIGSPHQWSRQDAARTAARSFFQHWWAGWLLSVDPIGRQVPTDGGIVREARGLGGIHRGRDDETIAHAEFTILYGRRLAQLYVVAAATGLEGVPVIVISSWRGSARDTAIEAERFIGPYLDALKMYNGDVASRRGIDWSRVGLWGLIGGFLGWLVQLFRKRQAA